MLLVITPTLGSSRFLEATVNSVACLPVPHVHVLVAPEAALANLSIHSPHCRLMKEPDERKGMYAAINAVLQNFPGAWTHFTYINDDDVFETVSEAHWRVALSDDPALPQATYGRVGLLDENSRRTGCFPVSKWPLLNRLLWHLGKTPYTQHGLVVSRAAYEKCGPFDARYRYVADMDYLLKLERHRCKLVYSPELVASFRIRRGQLSSHSAQMESEMVQVRQEHKIKPPGFVGQLVGLFLLVVMNPSAYLHHIYHFGFRRRKQLHVAG